jgi:hypothetical protein
VRKSEERREKERVEREKGGRVEREKEGGEGCY